MSESQDNPKQFPIPIALLLSLWCGAVAAFNANSWFLNTWRMFVHLRWHSFVLLVNPTAYFWFFLVSSCWYVPLIMVFRIWRPYFNLKMIALLAIFVPVAVTLLFSFPSGWYPIMPAENGGVWVRFLPFL